MPATYLSSQQSVTQRRAVFRELGQASPTCKLLYVTPEQLVKSNALIQALQGLHSRRLLACFVIDEVNISPHRVLFTKEGPPVLLQTGLFEYKLDRRGGLQG